MTAEEVAARYNKLPGFRLVDYHSVALPLWLISFDALVIAEKKHAVVDEFILRAVERQVNTIQDLAGFLGLSEKLVLRRLGTLSGNDLVVSLQTVDGNSGIIKLTARGIDVVRDAAKTPPRREKLVLAYDAIARQPITGRIARESFRTPQQIKQYGLFELPALPGRSPDETELGRINYNTALPRETRKDQKIHQVLSAQKVGTMARRYREGIMLIYSGATDAEQVAVRFFSIDGRPMPEVDRGFQLNHGLQRLGIQEQLKKHRTSLERELMLDADYKAVVDFAKTLGPSTDVSESLAKNAKLAAAIEEKQVKASADNVSPAEVQSLKAEIDRLRQEKETAQKLIDASPGRFLEPHEHVPLFEKSLRDARKRLLVISPWINDRVMEPKLRPLEELLRRGVDVFIGYGITERGPDDRKSRQGDQTLAWLQQKCAQYKNLHVVRLGDTHAKVLLMDERYVVVGSFNWMSFGGFDRNENGVRVVREELSSMVTTPALIEQMFVRYRARFDKYLVGGSPKPQSELERIAFPEAPRVEPPASPATPQRNPPAPIAATPTKNSPPAKSIPMGLTPRMIAIHLKKKTFVIIATAMEKKYFATINEVLPDEAIKAIFEAFAHPLPSPTELANLRSSKPSDIK
jgi:hypothetical protein